MKTLISQIMEEELHSPILTKETNDDFIQRVCSICLDEIELNKCFSPMGFGEDVVNEIELAVIEIFKMKTYGYYNLTAFRKAHLKKRVLNI